MKNLNLIAKPNYTPPQMTFTRASTGTYINSVGYISTAKNNQLRYDYDPTTLVGKGWLFEESRTNLLLSSVNFTNASQWTSANVSIYPNQLWAPDGTQTGYAILETAVNSTHQISTANNMSTITAGQPVTFSIFINIGNYLRNSCIIQIFNNTTTNGFSCGFNCSSLTTGTVGSNGSGTGLSASLVAYPQIANTNGGWVKLNITGIVDSTSTSCYAIIYMCSAASPYTASYTGNTSYGLGMWGAQLEQGNFATSYIPTTTTAVTRSSDLASCQIPSGGYNYTLFTQFDLIGLGLSGVSPVQRVACLSDYPTGSTRVSIFRPSNIGTISFGGYPYSNAVYGTTSMVSNQPYNVAVSVSKTNQHMVCNGELVSFNPTGYNTGFNRINIGSFYDGNQNINGHIQRILWYPKYTSPSKLLDMSTAPVVDMPTPSLNLTAKDGVTPPQMSVTRASTATYTDKNGVVKTSLANQLRHDYDFSKMSIVTNYCLYSDQIDNAIWNKFGSSCTSNSTYAPDGTLTADLITEDTTTAGHGIQQSWTIYPNQTYTLSMYVKANGRTKIEIDPWGNNYNDFVQYIFDLTNGTYVYNAKGGASVPYGASIISVGNGWYRISVSSMISTTITTGAGANIYLYTGASASYTGNGTSGIYFWGVQFERGVTKPSIYVPTTTTSAYSVTDLKDSYRGWLIEDSKTNSHWYNTALTNITLENVTLTSITSPDGTSNAYEMRETATASEHRLRPDLIGNTISLSATQYVTVSCFAAQGNLRGLKMTLSASNGSRFWTTDWATGGISASAADSFTLIKSGSIPYPNGWYRYWATFQTSTDIPSLTVFVSMTGSVGSAGSNYDPGGTTLGYIKIFAPQLEVGAFPSSVIYTPSNAAVTRDWDVVNVPTSSFPFNTSEGTLLVEAAQEYVSPSNMAGRYVRLDDGTNGTNLIDMWHSQVNDNIYTQVYSSGAAQATYMSEGLGSYNKFGKQSFAWKQNDFASCGDAGAISTDTSGSIPQGLTMLRIGGFSGPSIGGGSGQINGYIKRVLYWPKRLANNILQKITR